MTKASTISRATRGSEGTDRRQRIQALLNGSGRLSVHDLARRLGVTTMTIRRDLQAMEEQGLLVRTHGGCVQPGSPLVRELSFSEKAACNVEAKQAIAREIVRRLRPGESVYLDTGTTCAQIARMLPAGQRIRVVTNNLRVAMDLFGRPGMDLQVFGGQLAPASPDLVGATAAARAMEFRFDTAILGADALDPATAEFGAADMDTAALSRAARQQARRIIVAADASKIGRTCPSITGRLGRNLTLVTDSRVPVAQRRALARTGASIVYATVSTTRKGTP